jgi:prepilin-type N-terminal cleavage/methylation domain-containing protein
MRQKRTPTYTNPICRQCGEPTTESGQSGPVSAARGFSLLELLVGLSIVTFVSASVFTGLSQVMLFAAQDEIAQDTRADLLITMGQIRKDLHMSTNVVPQAGGKIAGGDVLVLRQPVLDAAEEIVDDAFQFVTYSVEGGAPGEGGLLREVWATEDAAVPTESRMLNNSVIGAGFLFGGKSLFSVTNMSAIRDVEMVLISARETGLRMDRGEYYTVDDFSDLDCLHEMLQYGMEFPYVRMFIDYINSVHVDVTVASSMGSATMRNRKALGLKTPGEPVLPW